MEPIQISVSENLRQREHQERRRTFRLLLRTFWYLTSLIPAVIVAWKMDLLPFVGQPAPPMVVQQRQQPQAPPKQVIVRQEPRPPKSLRIATPVESVRIERDLSPVEPIPVGPVEDNEHTVTVKLDLKETVIRVICSPDGINPKDVLCDVLPGPEISAEPLRSLRNGAKRDMIFAAGIHGVTVGAEVKFNLRGDAAVIEIRPKYRLPSGDEEAMTQMAGLRKAKLLTRQALALD